MFGPDVMKAITRIITTPDQDRHRLYQFIGPKVYSLNVSALHLVALVDVSFKILFME